MGDVYYVLAKHARKGGRGPNDARLYFGGTNVAGWANGVDLDHAIRWTVREDAYDAMRMVYGTRVVRIRRRPPSAAKEPSHGNV